MGRATFAEIARYLDEFHEDVSQLLRLVEALMDEKGYEALVRYGNKACWHLTSHYAYPSRWRAPYVARVYVPQQEQTYTDTIAVLASFEAETALSFPPLLCVRYLHGEVDDAGINSGVFETGRLRSLLTRSPDWHDLRLERGWCVAAPAFDSATTRLEGYILNLYDLVDRQRVLENIVAPLTSTGTGLDDMLTVQKHVFPAMAQPSKE